VGKIDYQFIYFLVFLVDWLIVLQIINSALDREITWPGALGCIILLLGVNGIMMKHAGDPVGPALAFVIIAFAATHRLLRELANQRALLAIELQDLREYQRMIMEQPKRPYPYKALGDYFFNKQLYAEAIPYYEQCLSLTDDPEVRWRLDYAREEVRRQRKGTRLCPMCLNEIPRHARECPMCGHYLGGFALPQGVGRRLYVFALGAVAVALIVWAVVRLVSASALWLVVLLPLALLGALYARAFAASRRLGP
jgi:tetratricopeptide (TPR) repeat protein